MSISIEKQALNPELSILVVEDSDILRATFRLAFGNAHLVSVASDAAKGWESFCNIRPHIVFVDIGLPDCSGHDLARRMKGQRSDTYIVMATASHDRCDKMTAAQNQANGFIIKPFTKNQINSFIDHYQASRPRP